MGWRGDIALGKYGNLPRILMDKRAFPHVSVGTETFYAVCPHCASQIPCLDISFSDGRDRSSCEARKRTGLHMPVHPGRCPGCGIDIVYDDADA